MPKLNPALFKPLTCCQQQLSQMTTEEKIREIMLSEELPESEKLDRLHALIPADVFEIDNLNQATPAQLRQLKDGLAITEAMQNC
jgi:hypothetical protein